MKQAIILLTFLFSSPSLAKNICDDLSLPEPSFKKTVIQTLLSQKRLPRIEGYTSEELISLLAPEEKQKIEDQFFTEYRKWVKANRRYPPSFEEFAESLGITRLSEAEQKLFADVFDEKYGIFKGFNNDFINHARTRDGDYAKFLSKYLNTEQFGIEIQNQMKAELRNKPAMILGGFISEQPLADGIVKAMDNLRSRLYPEHQIPVVITPAYGIA